MREWLHKTFPGAGFDDPEWSPHDVLVPGIVGVAIVAAVLAARWFLQNP